ncbi:mannose-6-phosphate isomerase, class I [Corynebacterium sp. USCH3]|uniref:mannose-6-phosphate isomerase, class I n=1 Tax=Corynebacterium sp. USCH3 TaxID=3024840 RepID=UPI0030AD4C5F
MPEAAASNDTRSAGSGASRPAQSDVALLEGRLRPYPWGSRTALAELTGRPSPSPRPEAELWFGAHPEAPSILADSGAGGTDGTECADLLTRISLDPAGQLGETAPDGRLPFLLKLLAADQSLSLQAHPTREQAVEGFARENAEGIPTGSPNRNYKDDNHKPELLVALTRFEALAGFRPVERTRALLEALGVAELERYTDLLSGTVGDAEGLRAVVTTWISLPVHRRLELIEVVLDACRALAARSDVAPWMTGSARAALELSEQHPGDAGILVSLLLNHVVLSPGEALFLSAGNLHAYLRGTGVEIMANSDNVLRGGLTTKHVDVPELMKVVDFTPVADPVQLPGEDGVFATPVPEFELRSVGGHGADRSDGSDRAGDAVAVHGPAIVLAVYGNVEVAWCDAAPLTLTPGQAAWVPASATEVTATGAGHYFVATVG